jgi:hypothetical protein
MIVDEGVGHQNPPNRVGDPFSHIESESVKARTPRSAMPYVCDSPNTRTGEAPGRVLA